MNTSTTNTPFRHVPKALAVALSLAFAAPMAMHPAFAQDSAQSAPEPVPPPNTRPKILFTGRSTAHRERFLGPVTAADIERVIAAAGGPAA